MYAMQHEPERLAELGYVTRLLRHIEVIIPPLCVVAAGTFLMGSDPFDDPGSLRDERPRHGVRVASFAMMRFPVTVAEYACYTRIGGEQPEEQETQWRAADHPETHVTWHEALAYARWLSEVTGRTWRLPTEAEWEKAARWDAAAGHARLYPWGDRFDAGRCNTSESGRGGTAPVGVWPTSVSPYGVEDLAGNVWEWTSSVAKAYPYDADDGRETPNEFARHVLRGGSWRHDGHSARAACRSTHVAGGSLTDVGFRLVCEDGG
ncbi:MAG: SUMF1/EgtB/PvdO family nonheme iron enzyme [Ktedonobacterales bacterium]|nr:SUMF1/EgtB/PvdO family nonheme iron enzyme [Ktedonobacterales bacterium]